MANDPMAAFLESGGKTDVVSDYKSEQPALPEAANDPMGQFLQSGGQDTQALVKGYGTQPTQQPDQRGYLQKIKDAAVAFNESGSNVGDTLKAVGENALAVATGAPVSLLKHGVEEGAYLSGQSPEQAAQTAQRVIPINGYQPSSETGKSLSGLLSALNEPVIDVAKKGAELVGLSPAAQNIAGDFAPVIAGEAISKAPAALRTVKNAPGEISQGWQNAVAKGRALEQQPATSITPQMIRGQEPVPAELQQQAPINATPKEAPPITLENASPQLKAAVAAQTEQGTPINQTALQRQLVADSLPVPGRLSPGQAAGDIGVMSKEFNLRGKRPEYAQLFNEQNGTLIQNINAIRDKAAPEATGLDHVQNGQTIIDAYNTADSQLKSIISQRYKALEDANGGQFPLDGKAFVDAADQALAQKLKTHYVPPEVRATLNDLRDGGNMTFEDFETLRSDLAETARSAADGKVRAAASIVRQQLEDMPMPAGAEHLKPLADAARQAAKARFDLLEADPAYKAAVTDKIAADDFVQKYIVNGKKANLQQMQENLASDPAAVQSVSAAAINYLKNRAGIVNDNGNFSQSGFNKALEQLKPKAEFIFDPVTRQQLGSLGDYARWTQEQPRGSTFNNSNTFSALATHAAEGALDVGTKGIYGALKNVATGFKQSKEAQAALKPGAGIALKDIGK